MPFDYDTDPPAMRPEEFKAARKDLGLSVSLMGAMLGVTRHHVCRMEMPPYRSGHRIVTETMRRLVQAYLDGYRPYDWPKPRYLRRGADQHLTTK